jgi:hypothetical protein
MNELAKVWKDPGQRHDMPPAPGQIIVGRATHRAGEDVKIDHHLASLPLNCALPATFQFIACSRDKLPDSEKRICRPQIIIEEVALTLHGNRFA